MEDSLLSWYQALQLLALGPCLFMLFFLCVAGRLNARIVVPLLYFLSLACGFFLPLLELFSSSFMLRYVLMLAASLTPYLSFLFIIQCLSDKIPPLAYWGILAVPVIGGAPLLYATLITHGEVCIYGSLCTPPLTVQGLYEIFSGSLTFLLTVVIFHRMTRQGTMIFTRLQIQAIVLALIVLNLAVLGIRLAQVRNYFDPPRAAAALTVLHIGFIYLILTSVFRLFEHPVELAYERIPTLGPPEPAPRDLLIEGQIRGLLEQEKLYRDMEMSREKLARKLAVTEGMLSRVVNRHFGDNVSMLMNRYRVEEAKERLRREDTAITTIAFEVGFSSIPSFNRVFKQLEGISPSEYRSQQRKEG